MGVERLRKHLNIETVIVTGEISGSVKTRAKKLRIPEYYLGVDDKLKIIEEIKRKNHIEEENIAFIGDDVNDYEMMKVAGFTGTPADGTVFIKDIADYVCNNRSGNGAFREFAELIIAFTAEKK
jgi:YrbI family 3-deoxy-D-manno-octulosonate 8-phosphate phosphatase